MRLISVTDYEYFSKKELIQHIYLIIQISAIILLSFCVNAVPILPLVLEQH